MNELKEIDACFGRGLPDGSTDDDKQSLADFRLRAYNACSYRKTNTLAANFAHDFAQITAKDFKLLDGDVRREL